MAARSHKRQKQSRLAFTSLPSSSPAAKEYNKQIQERAAAVTLESSPIQNKRRKLIPDNTQLDGVNDSMPTPAASHQRLRQVELEDGSESEEPVRSTQRRPSTQVKSRTRSRQQRLDFSNVRDADSFSPPMKLSSPARPHSSARAGMFGTQKQRAMINVSSDSEADQDHQRIESDEEELPSPRKLVAKARPKKMQMTTRQKRNAEPIAVNSDTDDNIVVSSRADPIEVESDGDEDDMPTTLGTQRRKQRARRKSRDSFISSSPPRVVDSDSDLEIIEKPKHRNRNASVEEESEVEPVTPSRSKLKRRRQMSQREKDDLEEDLDFLEPSSDVESPRKKRDTQSEKKSAKQKALDALKRRRSKQGDLQEDQDEGAGEQDGFDELYGDDDNYEKQPTPLKSSQMFRQDEWDEGFIDSEGEEENTLGIPDGVPLEFTRYASMKPKELFKFAVEWFVQKKINPAFSRTDEIYDLTFKKLDDEVAGLAGSKFKSSVWTPEFTMALNARPTIAYEPLDKETVWMHDTCDACNRSNHPATYQIQFQGKPYHRETLEDVPGNIDEDDEDDSSSDEAGSDEPTYDASGREISAESRIYYVGKFCMANARTAHALQHWRYHLNEWVIDWLDKNDYNTPQEVVKRDRMSTNKRKRYANKIADRLEREGEVKRLYRDYKDNVEQARDSKQGRYGGWE